MFYALRVQDQKALSLLAFHELKMDLRVPVYFSSACKKVLFLVIL